MKHKEQSEEDGMSNLMTILLARPLSTCSAERISARDVSDGTECRTAKWDSWAYGSRLVRFHSVESLSTIIGYTYSGRRIK